MAAEQGSREDTSRSPRRSAACGTPQQPEAFIHTVLDEEASGETKKWYDEARNGDGSLDNVASIHSLNPASGFAHWVLYRQALRGESPLTIVEREMVGVACSVANGCRY